MAAPEHVAAIAQTLHQSLSPDAASRRQAETTLGGAEGQQGFLLILLHLIGQSDGSVDSVARQTGAVYFKNVVKKLWAGEEEVQIAQTDKDAIKAQLVPLMISLGTPQTARLQSQIGEALSYIASIDFPEQWPTLIDDLVNSLTADNFVINNGVLATAHSIFGRWRSAFQSNALYSQINLVLARFSAPFGKIFTHVDSLLAGGQADPATLPLLGETLPLLIDLLYDLNCQDLAPFFEENSALFLGSADGQSEGFLRKYLSWERAELLGDDDDTTPGPIQKTRARICEIAELWAVKYADDFPQLPFFVDGVWNMLANVGPSQRNDQLVASALKFLSVVVKMGTRRDMFAAPETLRMFCEKIILPNMSMRESEEELFEDDPHEFIRQDLEPAADSETRRQAASDFTQALMANFSAEVTDIVKGYIAQYLQAYAANPTGNWKSKDTAIYLLTSIASRGSTLSLGVTSTNALVDVVDFFGQNVFADLQAAPGSVHPILVVDAIKFLYTFRNQLTKEQLVSVLPLLVQHLTSDNYVIHSYAAITIERILFIKVDKKPLFTEADVAPFAESILLALFANIERGGTPEKIAENDYLMKCAMRVIITARSALASSYEGIFTRLVAILGEISKNPSNPKFNQYCFESVSALIRFVCEANPAALSHFETAIFGPANVIITQDVAEFVPYIFQILAQLLELHPVDAGLPDTYKGFLQPLLAAGLWEQRGNVPALVRIWKALLLRGGNVIAEGGQVTGLLGVFQRLMGSKVNDVWALEVLQGLYEALPLQTMQPFSKQVFMLLLTRLQAQHSAYFKQSFTYFMAFLFALPNVGPNFVVGVLDEIQPGMFSGLLQSIVLANTQKTQIKHRKLVEVGLTRFLVRCDSVLNDPKLWAATFLAVIDMFNLPQDLTYSGSAADGVNSGTGDVSELDPEEAGFQSSFSKLGASESKARDPVADVPDAKRYASAEIGRLYREKQGQVQPALQVAAGSDAAAVQGWTQYMASNGDQIA